MKISPSWPHLILVTSPKPHLQVPAYWALRLQCINLGKHKHLVQNKKEAGKYLNFSPLWLNTFCELKKVFLFSGRTFHVLLLIITISVFAWHSRLTIFSYMPKNGSISAIMVDLWWFSFLFSFPFWESFMPAKSLQSCPTLYNPIDGGPPGSPIPGILQARTLEWVAISFSNAWKWKVKMKLLSCVRLLATPWTAAYQAPPSMGFSRQEYWSGVPLPSPPLCLSYW